MHQSRLNAFKRVLRIGADPENAVTSYAEITRKKGRHKKGKERKKGKEERIIYFILKIIILIF